MYILLMVVVTLGLYIVVQTCSQDCLNANFDEQGVQIQDSEYYDPDNRDDIFSGLEHRIDECKYQYS